MKQWLFGWLFTLIDFLFDFSQICIKLLLLFLFLFCVDWAGALFILFFFIEQPSELPKCFGGLFIFKFIYFFHFLIFCNYIFWKFTFFGTRCLRFIIFLKIRWIGKHWRPTMIYLWFNLEYFLKVDSATLGVKSNRNFNELIVDEQLQILRFFCFIGHKFFSIFEDWAWKYNLERCALKSMISLLDDNDIIAAVGYDLVDDNDIPFPYY